MNKFHLELRFDLLFFNAGHENYIVILFDAILLDHFNADFDELICLDLLLDAKPVQGSGQAETIS